MSAYKFEFKPYGEGYLLIGDTKPFSTKWKEIGGNFNRTLRGWVFRTEQQADVEKMAHPPDNSISDTSSAPEKKIVPIELNDK